MTTDPDAQNRAVPREAAPDSAGNAKVSAAAPPKPVASPEQLYEQAMARFAAIWDEWQQARKALLRG
jgi:hypothetical protein